MSPYTRNLQKKNQSLVGALSLNNINEAKFWMICLIFVAAVLGVSFLIMVSHVTTLGKDVNVMNSSLKEAQQKLLVLRMGLANNQIDYALRGFAADNKMVASNKFEYASRASAALGINLLPN